MKRTAETQDNHTSDDQQHKKPRIDRVKVLVCGDVNGEFHKLFTKVHQVNDKHGPFTCLLCTGKFYSEGKKSEELLGACDEESVDYLTGSKPIHIPTYFIDSSSHSSMALNTQQITKNLTYLGNYGISENFAGVHGFTVAHLSGSYDRYSYQSGSVSSEANHYTREDIATFEKMVADYMQDSKTIEVLLTNEWPAHILNCLPGSQSIVHNRKDLGSFSVTRIAMKALPKYHFAASEGFYFERLPFTTKVNEKDHVTRFLGLAKVKEEEPEPKKIDKFLYALNMSLGDQQQIPTNSTESPFEEANRKKQEERTVRRNDRKRQYDENAKFNTDDCWFCLKNTKLETQFLVSIGEESYLAMPKGGLTPNHVMVLPFSHAPYFTECPMPSQHEMERFIAALRTMFNQHDQSIIVYERNASFTSRPLHMMLHVIPVPKTITVEACRKEFLNDVQEKNNDPNTLHQDFTATQPIRECIDNFLVVNPSSDYLMVQFPDGTKTLYTLTGDIKTTANVGRTACRKLLQLPEEKDDWRKCTESDKKKEQEITDAFKKQFTPFDFTQ